MDRQKRRFLHDLFGSLFDLLFPPVCFCCKCPSLLPFCLACRAKIESVPEPLCRICGQPISPGLGGGLCAGCFLHRPAFDCARSLGLYQGVLRRAILAFKYMGKKSLAQEFAELLAEYLDKSPLPKPVDFLLPVPLHPRRLAQRGFNQAELLALHLGKRLGIRVDAGVISRKRQTPPQTRLSGDRRWENVRDAFALSRKLPYQGATILLVDDVLTTGATMNECARVLRSGGAGTVYGLALARDVCKSYPPRRDPSGAPSQGT